MTSSAKSLDSPSRDDLEVRHGVYVLTGYGLRVAVERGHLVVDDGVGRARRRQHFSRIDSTFKRLVIIGHSGAITLDAIAWLHGVGVPLIHLSHDGRVYLVSTPAARTLAQLRRLQAQAVDTGRGLAIARDLLVAKIVGQLQLVDQLPDGADARGPLEELRARAERARTLLEVRDCEARAARAYWRAWRRVPVRFVDEDARRRPRHWASFGTRISPLGGQGARKAVNPANAVLNYCYAMLEAEATIAALAHRLDPTLGVLHADREERPSLACDLMEPIRPAVDTFALSLFRDRLFTKDDVFELPDGQCRLLPPLTRELALTAALWAERATVVADQVASAIASPRRHQKMLVPGVPLRPPSARRRPRTRTAVVRSFDEAPPLSWNALVNPSSTWKGLWALRRARGADRQWDHTQGPGDTDRYRREVLPHLARIPLWRITAATGLSQTTASLFRRGLRIPNARHWGVLRALVERERQPGV